MSPHSAGPDSVPGLRKRELPLSHRDGSVEVVEFYDLVIEYQPRPSQDNLLIFLSRVNLTLQ